MSVLQVFDFLVIPREVSSVLFARGRGLGRFSTISSSSPGLLAGTALDAIIIGTRCVSYGIYNWTFDVPERNSSIVSGPPNSLSNRRFGAALVCTYFFDACCRMSARSICFSPARGPPSLSRYAFVHSHEQKFPMVSKCRLLSSYLYGACKAGPSKL